MQQALTWFLNNSVWVVFGMYALASLQVRLARRRQYRRWVESIDPSELPQRLAWELRLLRRPIDLDPEPMMRAHGREAAE